MRPAALFSLALPVLPGALAGQDTTQAERHSALAVQEVFLINFAVNRFDALIARQDWARVDMESWARNLRLGWEWDEDNFGTNMFAHPFHGASYFNAGRSNGLSYWASVPLAFLGSWTWEFFGETYRPSFNDFFMTSFGGIALGEMTHRAAATLRDTESRGTERIFREIGALAINPVAGVNRLIRGEWTRITPNPPEHDPGTFLLRLRAGVRRVEEDSTGIVNTAPTMLLTLGYGDLFDKPYRAPFDVFTVRAQVSPGGGNLNVLLAEGRLFQVALPGVVGSRHAVVVTQRYDYVNNPVYSFGAQGVVAGLASLFPLPGPLELRTRFAVDALILAALDAPFSGIGERTYDFGPGGGLTLDLQLRHRGQPIVTWYSRGEFLHSVSGAPANHVIAFSGLEAQLPLYRGFGVGLYASADTRLSRYSDAPENTRQFLETRLFVSWTRSIP